MLGPLRRSLGERTVGAALNCRTCTRKLHVQSVIRGAAAAPQSQTQEFSILPPESSKGTALDKNKRQTSSNRSSTPSNRSPKGRIDHGKSSSPPNTDIPGNPLLTATSLNSPHRWEMDDIAALYTPPTEQQMPTITRQAREATTVTYDWRKTPYRYLEEGLKLNISLQTVQLKSGKNNVRVKISASWAGDTHSAIGQAANKEMATNAAAFHLIMKDKDSPMFRNSVVVATFPSVTQDLTSQHRSSKVDVYDYAAQFDALPVFETIPIPLNSSKSGKTGYLCRITVQGTNIVGEGFHNHVRSYAEIGACVNFKKRAEEHHQGEKMMVKHINTLTSKTGEKFLQYCKMKQKDWEQYQFTSKSINGFEVHGQLHLGTRLLSECTMFNKLDAQAICYYLAARDMKAQDGKMWKKFVVYIHEHHGEILQPVAPLGVWMNLETIGALRNRLNRLMELERELEAFSKIQLSLSEEVDAELEFSAMKTPVRRKMSPETRQTKNNELFHRLRKYETNPELEKMRTQRAELPLNQYAEDVKSLFDASDICVLVGATGSGKTTQVPQLLLDQAIREGRGAECNIICTQPRRIAAMSVAKRVAAERGEDLKQSVGYRVRFNHAPPEWGGSITYATTGILLRQLEEGWDSLDGVSHIIVDEVHERDVQIDFLLVLLKRILEARRRGEPAPPVKIILMSATIDTTLFRKYFGAAFNGGECPFIEIPGRLFPVEKFYLDDIQTMLNQYPTAREEIASDTLTKKYLLNEKEARRDAVAALQHEEEEAEETGIDWSRTGSAWEEDEIDMRQDESDQPDLLIAHTIAHLCAKKDDGAVLVFLPGFKEIASLDNLMKSRKFLGQDFTDTSKYRIFMLHSSIPTMQQEVFNPLEPGVRKIILSTNIAETSVTIPEVAFVVDTCKHREKRYSQLRRSTALVCTWISQSSARQRAGRAGRVKPGEYYALIYPERHNALTMGDSAEIKRSDLQDVCLSVRSYGIKEPITDVLEECIEPPSSLAVVSALKALTNLGALDNNENVTPLGTLLAQLPVQPALGKMVLLGAIFKCLDPILILAAIESNRSFFLTPPGNNERNNEIRFSMALGQSSDHLALLNAYREWRFIKANRGRAAANEYAFQNLMHSGGLATIEKTSEQMLSMLVDWGLAKDIPVTHRYNNELGDPELNINSDVQPLVFALLTAGLMPNLAVQVNPILLQTGSDPKALIHPSSLNSNAGEAKVEKRDRYLGAGPPGTLVLFSSKSAHGGGVFLRETSILGPMTAVMFSGKLSASDEKDNTLYIDDWIPCKFESGVADNVIELTKCIDNFLERTWVRLKVLNARGRNRPYEEGASFYDADPSRDPVVKSVVEILERSEHLEKLRRKLEAQEFSARRARAGDFGMLR